MFHWCYHLLWIVILLTISRRPHPGAAARIALRGQAPRESAIRRRVSGLSRATSRLLFAPIPRPESVSPRFAAVPPVLSAETTSKLLKQASKRPCREASARLQEQPLRRDLQPDAAPPTPAAQPAVPVDLHGALARTHVWGGFAARLVGIERRAEPVSTLPRRERRAAGGCPVGSWSWISLSRSISLYIYLYLYVIYIHPRIEFRAAGPCGSCRWYKYVLRARAHAHTAAGDGPGGSWRRITGWWGRRRGPTRRPSTRRAPCRTCTPSRWRPLLSGVERWWNGRAGGQVFWITKNEGG